MLIEISEMIESWQLTDRQRLLDTSLSMSELNALGGLKNSQKPSPPPPPPPPPPAPPPRPPETYRQQLLQPRAHTEEPRYETRKTSRGTSARFLGFLRRPEAKTRQQQKDEDLRRLGEPDYQEARASVEKEDKERELLEVAAELKWLIAESTRQLADLCHEEKVQFQAELHSKFNILFKLWEKFPGEVTKFIINENPFNASFLPGRSFTVFHVDT